MLDPVPLQQPITELQTKSLGVLTRIWMNWFNVAYVTLFNVRLYSIERVLVPVDGFTYQIPANVGVLILNMAGNLTSGTVSLPATPVNRQRIEISTVHKINVFSVTSPDASVVPSPTSINDGQGIAYLYRSADTTWYRIY